MNINRPKDISQHIFFSVRCALGEKVHTGIYNSALNYVAGIVHERIHFDILTVVRQSIRNFVPSHYAIERLSS